MRRHVFLLTQLLWCLALIAPAAAQDDKGEEEPGDVDWGEDGEVPPSDEDGKKDGEEKDGEKDDEKRDGDEDGGKKDGDKDDPEGEGEGEDSADGPDYYKDGDEDDIDDWEGEIKQQELNQVKEREEVKVDVEDEPERIGVSGNWYQVPVDCLYCETVLGQNIAVDEAGVMRQFFDHLQINPDAKDGKFVFPSEGINRPVLVQQDEDRIVVFMYVIDQGERTTPQYCTIWDLRWLLRDQKLLYGRRYSVDAYQPFAFGSWEKGYKADESFLPREQLRTFLDLSPVLELNEEKKTFPVGEKAVLTYLGADAFVRSDFDPEPYEDLQARLFKEKSEEEERQRLRLSSFKRGVDHFEDRDYDKALEELTRAGELGEDSLDFHFYLGACFQGTKQFDKAIDEYRKVLEGDPRDTTTRFNVAVILEKQGRLKDALKEYRVILKYDPDDDEARNRAFDLAMELQGLE